MSAPVAPTTAVARWQPADPRKWTGLRCHRDHRGGSLLELKFRGGSGLNDRQYSFQALGNIAGSLGARLVLDRPCRGLGLGHNNNISLSCDVQWGLYFRLAFLDDGTDALVDKHVLDHGSRSSVARIDGTHGSITEQYDNARRASRSFRWHIHDEDLPQLFAAAASRNVSVMYKHRHKLCSYVVQTSSTSVRQISGEVARRLHLRHSHYVSLHIRRGDALVDHSRPMCDSRPDAVAAYVRCSAIALHNLTHKRRLPLLVFTDERSPGYITLLLGALNATQSQSSRSGSSTNAASLVFAPIVHAEKHIARALNIGPPEQLQDNYLAFAAGRELKDAGLQLLEMNRARCARCGFFSQPELRSDFRPFRRARL